MADDVDTESSNVDPGLLPSLDPLAPIELGEASGARSLLRTRRPRKWWTRAIIVAVLAWLILIGWSSFSAIRASGRADNAVAEIAAGGLAGAEIEQLRAIESDLVVAGERLHDPWMRPLEYVPFLGRQLRAAQTLDASALEAIGAGADAVEALDRARSSSNQLELLQFARAELQIARAKLATTVLPSSTFLLPPLVSARNRLGDQLVEIDKELDRFQAVADAFGSLIESDATYLLAAANTSEMGAGTGMLLSYGLLEIGENGISVDDFQSVNLLGRPSGVSIPDEIRDRWFSLDPGNIWAYTALLTPRVEEVGRITADMWASVESTEIDGVLIVNPVALQILLEAGGNKTVEISGETYPVDVVGRFFGRLQYQLYPDSAERRDVIGPVAAAAFETVFGDVADPQVLVDAIFEAVDGRHLMAWSRDPVQQQRWERLGMSGSLQPDSLMVSVLNAGGNKLDSFLEISSDVSWRPIGDRTAVRVEIEIRNTASGGEVAYVAGGGRLSADAGQYVGYVTVNLPAGATCAVMTGTTETNAAGSDGPTYQLVHILELQPGGSAAYELNFELPATFSTLTIEPSGRLPGISWTAQGEVVPDMRQTVDLDQIADSPVTAPPGCS